MMRTGDGKILVVERDGPARESLEQELKAARLECRTASDTESALGILSTQGFDFVLIDPDQHDGDLRGFSREVAKGGAILMCSGSEPDRSKVEMGMRLGARGFLAKPWPDAEALREKFQSTFHDIIRSPHELQSEDVHLLRSRCARLQQQVEEQARILDQSQESYNLDLSRMMTIIGNIMDGIVFVDGSEHITLLNPVAEDLIGVKSFMAIGKTLQELSGREDLLAAIREESANLRDLRDSSRVVEVHHTEQDLLYIRVQTSRVVDYRGQIAGTLIVMQDVTAEHKTDQLKNQYLSIVAHELRTPLTGIKTFSTMMAKGSLGPLTDKQVRVVESMREQSLRLEHQIDKLINLGHIESNEYGQDLEVFDLGELIVHATAPFEQPAKDRSIELEVCLPDTEQRIEGDRADLRRAVQALVENAVKFTPDGGKVWVETSSETDSIEVIVRDNGVGIDPRYHRRIFEKFFQVEDPLTRHHGGSGLGLFFVQGIVDAHGSAVKVSSKLGNGTKFSFTIPRYVADPSDTELIPTTAASLGTDS